MTRIIKAYRTECFQSANRVILAAIEAAVDNPLDTTAQRLEVAFLKRFVECFSGSHKRAISQAALNTAHLTIDVTVVPALKVREVHLASPLSHE